MNKFATGALFLFCGISLAVAATGPVINGLPASLAVGDTIIISASGGTAPYSWTSSHAGVAVTAENATDARLVVHSAVQGVLITVEDALTISADQFLDTYSYSVRIGTGMFMNGDTIDLPIYYANKTVTANLLSVDAVLPFDTTVIKFIGINFSGGLLASLSPNGLINRIADTLKIGIATTYPLGPVGDEQPLFTLRVTNAQPVISSQIRGLNFTGFLVNETLGGSLSGGSVTVDPIPNYPPVFIVAEGDTTVAEGTVLLRTFTASDANGDPLKYFLSQNPAGSAATIDSLTGQFAFSPDYFSVNSYNFEVAVFDTAGANDTHNFIVNVNNVNRAPSFTTVFPDTFFLQEGASFWLDVQADDPDLTPIYFKLQNAPPGMTIDSLSGELEWVPSFASAGTYIPIVEVFDYSGGTEGQPLLFIVADSNRVPQIVSAPNDTAVVETMPYGSLFSAVDPDNDTVKYFIQSGAPAGFAVDSLTGVITYTPGISDSGMYNIALIATDRRAFGTILHTYALHVINQNQSPLIVQDFPDSVFIAESQTFSFDFSATDPDGDALRYTLFQHPPGMEIDSLTGEVEWTPDYFQAGTYVPKIGAQDLHGGFTIDSLVIVVANTNRDPEFAVFPDSLYFIEGQAISFSLPAFDPDGDSLKYSESGAPFGMAVDSLTGEVTWTPDFTTGNLIYPVTFIVHDIFLASDIATKYFIVIDSNRTPVFTLVPNDTTILEGVPYSAAVTASDVDVAEQLRYYVISGMPPLFQLDSITGAISWTPDNSHAGVYPITILVTDKKPFGNIEHSFTITVNNVNLNPVIVSGVPDTLYAVEGQPYTLDIDATDADGNPIKYSVIDAPAGMTIDSLTGLVQWTPDFTQAGTYHPTFKATDSLGGFDSRFAVLITFNTNRVPQFLSVLSDTIISEGQLLTFTYTANDLDLEPLEFSLLSPVPGMSVTAAGVFQWQPSFSQAGHETVIVLVTDEIDVMIDTAIVTVLNLNNPPVFTAPPIDTAIARFDTLRVQYVAADPDLDSLTYSLWTGPSGATVSSEGLLEWIPPADANGHYLFIVAVSDTFTSVYDTMSVKVFRLGDVSGNGLISSFDASMVLRDQVEAIDLSFVQARVADVSGDTILTSFDASLILQYVVGLITDFPSGFGKQQEIEGILSAFTFRILPAQTEGEFELLVAVTKPSQVFGITMSLGFDTNIVVPKTMKQTALTDSMFMAVHFGKGQANLALAGVRAMNTIGDIARFTFVLKNNDVSRSAVLFTMKKFILNNVDHSGDIGGITMNVNDGLQLPTSYSIDQNFPNPFNPATTINYQLPKESNVTLTIYNMIGQEVRSLVNAPQPAGYHSVQWNGRDNNNAPVSSGVYLYKIIAQAGGKNVFINTKKMVFLK